MPALPFKLNQDRRRHIPEQKRKVTNWRDYDESLRRRGSLTVWGLPHHAIREETASPSRTCDPVRRDRSRHYVRLHRFRRPGDGTSGKQGVLAPLQTVPLPLGSTPPRPPGPSGRSSHPPTCGGERPQACAPRHLRFMPRRLATSRAQRLRAEKRTAPVSRMCAASYRAVRTITSPARLTAPVTSVSPD